jgi:hypothetical protein
VDVEMTKVLTRAQLEEIKAESLQIDELHYNADGFDRIAKRRNPFSRNYYRGV